MPGFNIRKHLKAYVKYGLHNGQKIVPGSLIFRDSPPKDPGIWKEVDTVKCCPKGGPCGPGGYWVDLVTDETYNIYPVSTTIDTNCNIYSLQEPVGVSNDDIQILKFNSKGNLIWNVSYRSSSYGYADWQTIAVSPNNENLVIVSDVNVSVLSTLNGQLKWSKAWGTSLQYVYLVGANFSSDGNLIVLAMDYEKYYFVAKINTETGVVITDKKIDYLIPDGYPEAYSPPYMDKDGNVYIGGTYWFPYTPYDGISCPQITKLDENFNFIWSTSVISQLDSYTNNTSFTIDSLGNSYIVGLDGGSLVKVNSGGDVQWGVSCVDSSISDNIYLYCCVASPEGDVFWVYNYANNWDGQDNIDEIIIVKFNTLGQKQWATGITYAPGGIKQPLYLGGWNGTNYPMEYKNGTISIPCVLLTDSGYDKMFVIKFSAETQSLGVFGDYIYRDVSSFINIVNSEHTNFQMDGQVTDTVAFSDDNEVFVEFSPITIGATVTNTKT